MESNLPIRAEEAKHNILVCFIFTLITFGIYLLFWNAHQMRVLNALLKRDEFSFWSWFFLCIVTFGFYHLYYQYKMGSRLLEVYKIYGKQPMTEHLPLISFLVTLFGGTVFTDSIHQYEINRLFEE